MFDPHVLQSDNNYQVKTLTRRTMWFLGDVEPKVNVSWPIMKIENVPKARDSEPHRKARCEVQPPNVPIADSHHDNSCSRDARFEDLRIHAALKNIEDTMIFISSKCNYYLRWTHDDLIFDSISIFDQCLIQYWSTTPTITRNTECRVSGGTKSGKTLTGNLPACFVGFRNVSN